jgi:CubicO group peptidase (beta-lactamase class C family)
MEAGSCKDSVMLTRLFRAAFAMIVSVYLPLSNQATVRAADPARPPGGIEWSQQKTAESGIDGAALESLYAELAREPHHDLKGIVIVRSGRVAGERYFNGDSVNTLHDIRSATKSITSLLMGIAVQKGLVHGVNDSIALYLPGLPKDGKEKIAIKDLLNMRSGLDANDEDPSTPGDEDNLDKSSDWIHTIYTVPMNGVPGSKYNYCSINAFLTGAIIENTSHMPLDEFARVNLFDPLGIRDYRWRHVPIDRVTGQGNLSITTRDLATIGELMLNDGVVNGRRRVSHEWVAMSLASQVAISDSDPYADSYGYMWYTKAEPIGGHTIEVHFASGNGGNKIYIVPSLHMVVAITSSAYNTNYGQRRSQDILWKILTAASLR